MAPSRPANKRKNYNTWIILGSIIVLAVVIYYFFYKKSPISSRDGFFAEPICKPASINIPEFLKAQSGLFPDHKFTCVPLATITKDYMDTVPAGMNKLHHTYNELVSETSLIDAFYDRTSFVKENPQPGEKTLVDAVTEYFASIIDGLKQVNAKIAKIATTSNVDAGLKNFVTTALTKYGTITDLKAFVTAEEKSAGIIDKNLGLQQSFLALISRFIIARDSIVSSSCSLEPQALALQSANKYFALYDIMKVLYTAVKGTAQSSYPGLTFDKLKAVAGYDTVKAFYLEPANMFTYIKRNDTMYIPKTTTGGGAISETQIVPKYATDDDYMSAITRLLEIELVKNVAYDGKLVKNYSDLGGIQDVSDNIYNNMVIFSKTCEQLASTPNCNTDQVKTICQKVNAIINNTGSILDPLPTSPSPTGTSPSPTGTGPTPTGTGPTPTGTSPSPTGTSPSPTGTSTSPTGTGPTPTGTASTPSPTGTASTPSPTGTGPSPTGTASTPSPTGTSPTPTGTASTPSPTGSTATTMPGAGGIPLVTQSNPPPAQIFDRATQEEWKRLWDDIAVLFTGRTGDVGEIATSLMNLTQAQRESICSTYCNGLYVPCTDICRLAKCSNCTNEPNVALTASGSSGTDSGYATINGGFGLLDNTDDNTWAMNVGADKGHIGPYIYQKDGDGISNIFAPYVAVNPNGGSASNPGQGGYSAYMLNNPNDPLYKAYISQLMSEYSNQIPGTQG